MQVESNTAEQIFESAQNLEVAKNEGELYAQELAIQKAKEEANNEKKLREAEMAVELAKKKAALNAEKDLVDIELAIKKEEQQRKLLAARFESNKNQKEYQLKLEQMAKDQEFEQLREGLNIKNESYTPNVLKSMVLDTTKDIYKSLNIKDMRVLNMGGGKDGNQDPAGQLLGQMLCSYKTIADQMDSK